MGRKENDGHDTLTRQWVATDHGVTPPFGEDPEWSGMGSPIDLIPMDITPGESDGISAAAVARRLDDMAHEFRILARRLELQARTIRQVAEVTGLH